MQLKLQFVNIQLGFLVHSPSLAQVGQLGLESLILELQLFLQLSNIQAGFLSHWPVLAQYGYWFSCPLLSLHTRPRIVGFGITGGRGVVLAVVVPVRKNVFSTFFLYIKPRTKVPLIRVLQYRHSDSNFPSISKSLFRIPHPTSRNPYGYKYRRSLEAVGLFWLLLFLWGKMFFRHFFLY